MDGNHAHVEPPNLDIYARPFIPQALKAVNDAPAEVVHCAAAPWTNFKEYVSTFAGSEILTVEHFDIQLPPIPIVHGQDEAERHSDSTCTATGTATDRILSGENYQEYFTNALQSEREALWEECRDHDLYRVPLGRHPREPGPGMFR